MTPNTGHPTCSGCGRRIGQTESLWRELESGTVRPCYTVDVELLRPAKRRFWHAGCRPDERRRDLLAVCDGRGTTPTRARTLVAAQPSR
jgi:hypothetical protein